ncbi:hypothetical protein TUZN_1919 [Thermoproteus uzoniensis 768-20]|uniref:Uncharacterized protein n=1 Tax=Thermoproteus uzoniensis (strain 768-20) TaxID=999630 RepID=F2L4E7_THEU7|nr:hypothetical protein [Thermoproteus uzoniensis]AEA13379.1 hypothetical protein TUZN_1919 [Thermoproteus uzoniensis 768-20]
MPPNANAYYPNLTTIYADVYNVQKTQNGWLVEVEFRYTPPPGVLATIVMFASPTGVSWTPMSPYGQYRLENCKVLDYTISSS